MGNWSKLKTCKLAFILFAFLAFPTSALSQTGVGQQKGSPVSLIPFQDGAFFNSGRSQLNADALNSFDFKKSYGPGGLDKALFFAVYNQNSQAMVRWMSITDVSAYPIMFGTPVSFWIAHAVGGMKGSEALEMSVSWVGATGGSLVLKHLIKRVRPFAFLTDVVAKPGYAGAKGLGTEASMPSGHAAIIFALATTMSLQHPEWYAVTPSTLIAASVATSRVWLGVHYPSDVAAGAILGISSAVILHLLIN